ncbi:MAG: hypothetical protein AAFV53_31045 [Myxococcota bacterium]
MWLLLSAFANADDFGLTIAPQVAIDLRDDRPGEDQVEMYTWMRMWAAGQDRDLRWFLEARALHLILVGDDTESIIGPAVGETGVEAPIGPTYLRAGLLIERWGRLDLLPVADLLNGRDLRVGPQVPAELARLPAPMARLQLPTDWGAVEVVWLPVPATGRTSPLGTDWSLVRQGMLEGLIDDVSTYEGDALTEETLQDTIVGFGELFEQLNPWTRWSLSEALGVAGLPPATGIGSDIAGRVEFGQGRFDGAVFGGLIRSRLVAPTLNETLVVYIQEERLPTISEQEAVLEELSQPADVIAPKAAVAGAEIGGLIGPIGVRAEGVWRSSVIVTQPWLQATERPQLSTGVGVDYARGSWLFVVESSWTHLFDPPEALLLQAADQLQIAGGIQGSVLRDRMSVRLGGLFDLTFREFSVQPAVTYRLSDAVELSGGFTVIESPEQAPRTFQEAATFQGGPLGYTEDNDYVQFGVKWIR